MCDRRAGGKVNVKLLILLIAVVAAIGVSLVVARQVRRRVLSERALAAGQAAFEKQDWAVAAKSFREYLGRNPDDLDILRKYGEASLAVRPLDAHAVGGAISAYRRIMELDPLDDTVSDPTRSGASTQLVRLYALIGNLEELAGVARTRIERDPNDLKAPLWLAEAQIQLNRSAEARQTLETFIQRLEALPGKHVEYVRACSQMSRLVAAELARKPQAQGETPGEEPSVEADEGPGPQAAPLDWLNKAVAYAPTSAEALVYRALFYRQRAAASDVNDPDRPLLLSLARRDLEAADSLGTEDPLVRHSLGVEWMVHGELDRAQAELEAADKLPKEMLKEQFLDIDDWTVKRFLLGSELAMRQGNAAKAAALADETLASLTEQAKGHRVLVLPAVVQAYVAAERVQDARRCLTEYTGLLEGQPDQAASTQALAALKAVVEAAENRPYAVIDLLRPVVGEDANSLPVLRMLAQAYGQTGQTARAVDALEQYRRLNPSNRQVVRELARLYARTGDFVKASDLAKEAASLDPTDVGVRLLRVGAEISEATGRAQGADTMKLNALSAELAGLRQQYPNQVEVRVFQSIVAASLGQPEQAERELKLAIEECENPLRAEIQLVGHYISAGRVDDAVAVCEAACRRQSGAAEPWLALCDVYMVKGDHDSARRSLRQGLDAVKESRARRSVSTKLAVLELTYGDRATGIGLLKELTADPQEIQARLLLLGLQEIREDPTTGEKLIGELRQAEGENGLWWRLYQASLWLSGENAAAKQKEIATLLQYCVDADPTWPAPALLLAQMYAQQGDSTQAEQIYRQGLLANPSAAEIADRLLGLLVSEGRYADAEKVLRQIQNPRIAAGWQVRLAVGAGDFSRAIDELRLKISNDSKDAASRVELARLLYQETKDAAQAMRYLDEAKAIAPDSRTLTAVRASILRGEGKEAEAQRVLDDYVTDRNDFEAYWMRAVYLAEAGDVARAEQDYRKLTTLADRAAAGYDLLGSFYVSIGRLDQGVAAVEEGLRAYPDDAQLKRRLMRLLFSRTQGPDRDRAFEILTELEARQPQDAELLMVRAMQILGDPAPTPQSLANAREKLEAAVQREPTAVNAHLALIGIAMRERQYQTAGDLAARALTFNPNVPALLVARARVELALGYPPMAAKLARQVLQQDPNNMEAIDVFTQAALGGRDRNLLEQARTVIEPLIRRGPVNQGLVLSKARVLAELEFPRDAIADLDAYCQTPEGSRSIIALVTLSDLHRMAGDMAQAEKAVQRAEQLEPNNQIVVHSRFLLLASMKRFDEIKQIIPAYISAKEQDLGIIRNAAFMLISSESPELRKEGIRLFRHAVSLWPTSAEAQLGLATGLYQIGDAEAAAENYRKWLQRHPDDTRALNDLAWILQERFQRYDEALELANRGIRIAPTDVHLLDTKGTILSNMPDRLAEAKSCFEEIIGLSSSDPRRLAATCLQLGRLCVKLDDAVQARQYLERALEVDRKDNVLTAQERAEIGRLIEGLTDPTASPSDDRR